MIITELEACMKDKVQLDNDLYCTVESIEEFKKRSYAEISGCRH